MNVASVTSKSGAGLAVSSVHVYRDPVLPGACLLPTTPPVPGHTRIPVTFIACLVRLPSVVHREVEENQEPGTPRNWVYSGSSPTSLVLRFSPVKWE